MLEKTKLSGEGLETILSFLEEQIETIPFEEFADKYKVAEDTSPDPDDIPYFALALKLNCPIWTNDKKLKEQNVVKVYSTYEIMQILRIY